MKAKFITLIALFTLILALNLGTTLAEDKPQEEAPLAAQSTPQAAPEAKETAETKTSAPAGEPAHATLNKEGNAGYALAIPSNLPGYEATSSTPTEFDSVKYTLGPDDVIEVSVMRHPEFSGIFPINSEGKIQYKFVGDIDIKGMTKKQVEEKLTKVLSNYLVGPEVSVTITEFKSKFIFVLGEVGQPGKYYIKSETISVRDAVVNSGLPTHSAAMRKCSLITPDKSGRVRNRAVNIFAILYNGDLRHNIEMKPGEILYVPATVMAKVIRVINPVATTVGLAASPAEDTSAARSAAKALAL